MSAALYQEDNPFLDWPHKQEQAPQLCLLLVAALLNDDYTCPRSAVWAVETLADLTDRECRVLQDFSSGSALEGRTHPPTLQLVLDGLALCVSQEQVWGGGGVWGAGILSIPLIPFQVNGVYPDGDPLTCRQHKQCCSPLTSCFYLSLLQQACLLHSNLHMRSTHQTCATLSLTSDHPQIKALAFEMQQQSVFNLSPAFFSGLP